jgi:hypothetical protein
MGGKASRTALRSRRYILRHDPVQDRGYTLRHMLGYIRCRCSPIVLSHTQSSLLYMSCVIYNIYMFDNTTCGCSSVCLSNIKTEWTRPTVPHARGRSDGPMGFNTARTISYISSTICPSMHQYRYMYDDIYILNKIKQSIVRSMVGRCSFNSTTGRQVVHYSRRSSTHSVLNRCTIP